MTDKDLRVRIKEVAVDLFNRNGYYGTTIRNIAKEVKCSLPMIYYYFNNKKELFDEIIKKDYFDLCLLYTSRRGCLSPAPVLPVSAASIPPAPAASSGLF